jgi:hypothetical protein
MKEDGYLWKKLLEASGGKLELSKCFFYLLTWKWDNKGNAIPDSQQCRTQIQTNDNNNLNERIQEELDIDQKDIQKSHKTLGTIKNITGNETDHYLYLLEKSDNIAKKVLNAQFNRRQARIAYHSCYIPAMEYSLAATNLTEQQTNKIQSKATNIFLNQWGYERHFHRTMVYHLCKNLFPIIHYLNYFPIIVQCNKVQLLYRMLNVDFIIHHYKQAIL